MTKTIELTSTGLGRDSSGNISILTGINACKQNCETAMKTLQGEAMYAADSFMPYQSTVWDNYNPKLFEAAARIVLSAVQDVVSVLSFTQELDSDGLLSYEAIIQTSFGVVTVTS